LKLIRSVHPWNICFFKATDEVPFCAIPNDERSRPNGKMKRRSGCRPHEHKHGVGPSRFLFVVNIFILAFHVVAVQAKGKKGRIKSL
jgi:hypothetical protein